MQGISKQEYRQARRLLRDNGKAAIGWMTPVQTDMIDEDQDAEETLIALPDGVGAGQMALF